MQNKVAHDFLYDPRTPNLPYFEPSPPDHVRYVCILPLLFTWSCLPTQSLSLRLINQRQKRLLPNSNFFVYILIKMGVRDGAVG